MRTPAAVALALLASLVGPGCAGHRVAGTGPAATGERGNRAVRAVADRLVLDNDAAGATLAAREALARKKPPAWSYLGASLLARRGLDAAAEIRHLAGAVNAAPADPLALPALRRLSELAETSPGRAREVERAVAPLVPKLTGLAAYRARVARVTAAEVLGEHVRAAELRAENGAVTGWTLAGPFGQHAALDFETAYPPEQGELPGAVPGPLGLPPRSTRALPAPDGSFALVGEPGDGDVFYLAADLDASRGGLYLAAFGTQMSARAWLDGRPVLERRASAAHLATIAHVPLELSPGVHRLVVKVARGTNRDGLHVGFARKDGEPSDVRSTAARPGPLPAVAPGDPPPLVYTARELASLLEDAAGPVLARLLAARDGVGSDRESAKALLAEAVAAVPDSAALLAARADALDGDPTLDAAAAGARVEADLREALSRDPGNAEVRVELARLLVRASRLDDADAVLSGLEPTPAARPAALEMRARAAEERGLSERAEALAGEGGQGATCGALDLALALAERRRALSREDELARLRASCRGGRERLAGHLRRRGDAGGAAQALRPVVEARPWDPDPTLARASALVAAGDLENAVGAVEAMVALWPRNTRLRVRLGELRELAGHAGAGRAERERALLLDGTDLGLRRALALEDGSEVLEDLAEDGAAALRAYAAAPRPTDTSSTMVLDAAAVEIHPGGVATERTHQIIHVLDARGVEQFGEVTVPAGADVLVLRTQKPDGRRLEPERAGSTKGSVSLAGLEAGDFVEMEWVRAERGWGAGYVADPFYFQVAGTRIQRSSYAVAAPAGLGLEVDAHSMSAPPVRREGTREVVRAERTAVPAFVPEPGAPPPSEYLPFLHVGLGGGREALQRQVSEAMADKTRPTEELTAFARAIGDAAGPGASPEALVRAAYARVSRSILGNGGGLGEDASEVLSRGRGSRLQVLRAVLGQLGLRARLVLVRPFAADPTPYRFPHHGLYGQVLLRVEAGGETFWLDPSYRQSGFGALPAAVLDAEGLVLAAPGEPLEVTRTPARAPVEERREVVVRLALAADGSAEVSGTDTYRGALGAGVKAALERLDPKTRRQAVESMLARSFRGIALAEASFEGEENPEAPLIIRWKGTSRDAARAAGAGRVIDGSPFAARLGARFVQVAARTTPLLLPAQERSDLRLEIVPPPGLGVKAGPREILATPFGRFERSERLEGATLVREEELTLERGRVAPDRYEALAAFAAAVDAAQERAVVLSPTTPGEAPPAAPRS